MERTAGETFEDVNDSKVDLFGDYAETDLDQPTDYSLRYAEDDTDEDEKQGREYFPGSMQEDTVKTYCTEGTPYETPFNFSTATSMSDLRVEELKDTDISKKTPKKANDEHKEIVSFKEKVSEACDEQSESIVKKLERKNSGIININIDHEITEKPVNYYEDETPAGFSRVNSLSSLSSSITNTQTNVSDVIPKIPLVNSPNKVESERSEHSMSRINNDLTVVSRNNSPLEGKSNVRTVDKEGKMVTFCGHDDYAEQTPLMFSRCSSLGSLSGFEQHSIHDDRSSIVSDFSRRTSGIVSPSELPDSPTQTVPPSPRNQKSQGPDYVSKIQEEAVRPPLRRLSYPKSHMAKTSVFEDDIATFKEESTPIEFSTATSLSSLSIDDELKMSDYSKSRNTLAETSCVDNETIKDTTNDKVIVEAEKDQEQISDGDEDDEDMLAACISMGMQNNRYRHSFKPPNIPKSLPPESPNVLVRYRRSEALNRMEPRVSAVPIESPAAALKPNKVAETVPDTVHVYCTEDTPADISPVGSHSNLSALSMPSVLEDVEKHEESKPSIAECSRNDLSDDSSNLSGDDEKILDECIQSGMPKVRQITPPPISCIHFGKKPEASSQKFNVCAPSTSPVESNHGNKNSIIDKPLCHNRIEHESALSDDSPNHSEDEAILSECIQSAMPKARLTISPSLRPQLPRTVEMPTMNHRTPSATYASFASGYTERPDNTTKKPTNFDDALSEEEKDYILAQRIQSGIPKVLNISSNTSASPLHKSGRFVKPTNTPSTSSSYLMQRPPSARAVVLPARQLCTAIGNDISHRLPRAVPNNFIRPALRASNVNVGHSTRTCDTRELCASFEKLNIPPSCVRRVTHMEEPRTSRENIMGSRSQVAANCRSPSYPVQEDNYDESCRVINKRVIAPSHHSPVLSSSFSEEGSPGSVEEWALVELCIEPGMPRNRYRVQTTKPNEVPISNNHDDCEVAVEDNYSVCSYNSYVCKT